MDHYVGITLSSNNCRKLPHYEDQEKIVLSGISGVFPNCENIAELSNKLFSKENLITDMPDINFSVGKLKAVNKFDAQFFGITREHAELMDPMCRILLEKAYEAIIDAGYNPIEFKGSNMAVYVANCTSETEMEGMTRTDIKGALICERAQSFLANRISYWLGVNGPSCTINTACSSSLYAMDFAVNKIRNGECEMALVGSSNLCLTSGMMNLYRNLGITSSRCKSFDDEASGFCKSEAICMMLLQKVKHARRIYAEVIHIKTNNDGYKKQSILFPSSSMQSKLMNEMYQECNVPKHEVVWVEAHGTGTRVGDYQEMKSLETLCENRSTPLLCGCVKSSTGHTEASSGLCSIVKVIIAMETGLIPPNINFSKPQRGIKALEDNKIKIITETTPWNGGYVAINNFGIGGSNAHALLKSNTRRSKFELDEDKLYLVVLSGRTKEAVNFIIDYLLSIPLNTNLIKLLHQVHKYDIPRHEYRGYAILNARSSVQIRSTQNVQNTDGKKPIWYIYPGMGSQWNSMATELLKLHQFSKSIEECHRILERKNFNLIKILTSTSQDTFKNILYCFVGITSMMIALTDLLESIGIKPAGLIGHSFGEIGCAYASKCFSKTQALDAAYYRGVTSMEMNTINGLMAVIGLDGQDVQKLCLLDVQVVCYNGTNSCTVSGHADAVKQLIKEVKAENIFATEIYSSGIAYHSSHIKSGGPIYRKYLEKIVAVPKRRPQIWVSTSAKDTKDEDGQYCSADYFVNNFIQPVYFQHALDSIPENAITIEISPHSILSTVLNSTLCPKIINISLVNKNSANSLQYLLTSLGNLYENKVDMNISQLYPSAEFPVCRGTPMISPLIKWNHSEDWYVPYQNGQQIEDRRNGQLFVISYDNDECLYLKDCIINSKNVYPECGYLEMVWKTLAQKNDMDYRKLSVVFRHVKFYRTIQIPSTGSLSFYVSIMQKGLFEVTLENDVIVDGYVETMNKPTNSNHYNEMNEDIYIMQTSDIYKEFRIKGYNYQNNFQQILCCNSEGTEGKVRHSNNWILFMNSLLQFLYFYKSTKAYLTEVSQISIVEIDVTKQDHYRELFKKGIPIKISKDDVTCGGIKLKNIKTSITRREESKKPVLQTFQFIPYFSDKILSMEEIIRIIMTLVLDNNITRKINIIEIPDNHSETPILSKEIDNFLQEMTFYKSDITIKLNQKDSIHVPPHFKVTATFPQKTSNMHLIILPCFKENPEFLSNATLSLADEGFILTREKSSEFSKLPDMHYLKICAIYNLSNEKLFLWRKILINENPVRVKITSDSFQWVSTLQQCVTNDPSKKIILYSKNDKHSGILGFYKCIRKESYGCKMRCILIPDTKAPSLTSIEDTYNAQVKLNLAINIYKNDQWGFYVPFKIKHLSNILSSHVYLRIKYENDVKKLYWIAGEMDAHKFQINPEFRFKFIAVHYVKLSENYLQLADTSNGYVDTFEFSGKNAYGDNIIGISYAKDVSNLLLYEECIFWQIGDHWPLEDSVMTPKAFLTAFLVFEAHTAEVNTIIVIQNGCTPTGTALIQLALQRKYTVITLEDIAQNCKWITRNFSTVKSFHLDETSYDTLIQVLEDNTVDILILSKFQNTPKDLMTLVKHNGEIIYTGDENIIPQSFENIINNNINFRPISIDNVIRKNPRTLNHLKILFQAAIEQGLILPVVPPKVHIRVPSPIKHYSFINMVIELLPQQGNFSEKNPKPPLHESEPRHVCSGEDTYIICGGLGGMGFELADWLVSRGAKKLVLVSRTGKCDGYKVKYLSKWRTKGVYVLISMNDISTEDGVRALIEDATRIGNVSAIYNSTLVLEDALFQNQNEASFKTVSNPKAAATIYLDKISRIMCPHLKHFVVFSSIVCGYGNAGQTNYGYANSVMEQVCEMRKRDNLPALAVEWAGVADVGYLENVSANKLPNGTLLQPIRSCLEVLDSLLCQSECIVSSFILAENEPIVTESAFSSIKRIIATSKAEIQKDTTLKQIGLDSIIVTEIKSILEQQYNIIMNTSEIFDLRIHELWDIENQRMRQSHVKIPILHISILEEMYKNLIAILSNEDDILHLPSMVRLESITHKETKLETVSVDERTVFLLPGVEGAAGTMKQLAENLDFQVICAQYPVKEASITRIASILLPKFETYLEQKSTYHIIAHSFGGLVAMEIVHALEQKGKTGYLYLVDSSPKIVKWISNTLFKYNEFYANIVGFVRALRVDVEMEKFTEELFHTKDWASAVEFTMKSLPKNTVLNKEWLKILLNMSHERHHAIDSYVGIPKRSLSSTIIHFKPKENILPDAPAHELTEYCDSTVKEFIINGNHFTMLSTITLAHYIRVTFNETVSAE